MGEAGKRDGRCGQVCSVQIRVIEERSSEQGTVHLSVLTVHAWIDGATGDRLAVTDDRGPAGENQ